MSVCILELNEINFEIAGKYASKYGLSHLQSVIEESTNTTSETEYNLLEPWIQWVTVRTGMSAKDHKCFNLGDIEDLRHESIFDAMVDQGYSIGLVSPMNCYNNRPSGYQIFVPDPWTNTAVTGGWTTKRFYQAIKQAVNDNSSGHVDLKSKLNLVLGIYTHTSFVNFIEIVKYFLKINGKSWRKAIFLDMILSAMLTYQVKKRKLDCGAVFLNAGAHIQHHYFFNSEFVGNHKGENPSWYIEAHEDPLKEVLFLYNNVIKNVKQKCDKLIVLTGLSQEPYPYSKFYYRVSSLNKLFADFDIPHASVSARMTRDFTVFFEDEVQMCKFVERINMFKCSDGNSVFSIGEYGKCRIFCYLNYPREITENATFYFGDNEINFHDYVNFVAIKNGSHDQAGYLYVEGQKLPKDIPLRSVNKVLRKNICGI